MMESGVLRLGCISFYRLDFEDKRKELIILLTFDTEKHYCFDFVWYFFLVVLFPKILATGLSQLFSISSCHSVRPFLVLQLTKHFFYFNIADSENLTFFVVYLQRLHEFDNEQGIIKTIKVLQIELTWQNLKDIAAKFILTRRC